MVTLEIKNTDLEYVRREWESEESGRRPSYFSDEPIRRPSFLRKKTDLMEEEVPEAGEKPVPFG